MANDYPNGWKDGWSSADHAEESYSPYAWERAQRQAKQEKSERKQTVYKEPTLTEYEKEQIQREQQEKDIQDNILRRKAVRILVDQKRDSYYRKNLLKRAGATLSGKSFNKMKPQITAEAQERVDAMNSIEVEHFVEAHNKNEGRTR